MKIEVTPVLSIDGIDVGYGHVTVLRGVSLAVPQGKIVALVGSNGAGKSTLLRAISGILRPTAGTIRFQDNAIETSKPSKIVDLGILHVAEGRRLFRRQTVADNLELGLFGCRLKPIEIQARYDFVFELFPILKDRLRDTAGILSGGQQQMLAIGQALMRAPRLLILDEPSLGLSPLLVDQVMDVIVRLRSQGTTILLVEQMVERALEIADYGYVLQNGIMIGQGSATDLRAGDLISRAYMGV